MIKRLFGKTSSITAAAIILGVAGLLSRIFGVVRDRLLATTFGTGPTLDAYYAAFRIPDFVFNLLVLGALSAGFIPIFSEYLQKSKKEAWKLADAVFTLLAVSLIVISGLLFIFTPQLMKLLTPGFSADVLKNTVTLTRIMLFSPILLGLSSLFGGILQSFKHFFAYSFAPILYNVGIIIGILFFVKPFGINGLAWGVVFGALMHMIMQGAIAIKLGWRPKLVKFTGNLGIKEMVKLMGPRTATLAITQINLLVITVLASTLPSGRLAIFNLAQNLAYVPIGLFGISFAVASFPALSEYIAQKKEEKFTETIYKTLLQILFFLLPTLVLYTLLDEQFVRIIYGAGEFDWPSTLRTARTLLFLVPGIFAQSLLPLFARAYYAQKNTKYPLFAALTGLIVNAVLAIIFAKTHGVIGLAFAFSSASIIQLLVLILNKSFLQYEHLFDIRKSVMEIIWAVIAMLIIVQLTKQLIGPSLNLLTGGGVLLHLLIPSVLGGAAYLLILRAQGSEQYWQFEEALKGKLLSVKNTLLPVVATGEEDDFFDN